MRPAVSTDLNDFGAARGISFAEVNVTDHPEAIPELLKLTRGARIVPVVVEQGRISVAPDGGGPF